MTDPRLRPALFLSLLAAAGALGGCLTQRASPSVSQAVLDARAHRDVAKASACASLTSPQSIGFGFGEGTLSDLAAPDLEAVRAMLACHPAARALIVGQADQHGTADERRTLARARAAAVSGWLQAHGIAAGRLASQAEGKTPAGDDQRLVIMAEGRRW
jgi:outer membrane protein OmpA-like peptidoglycan-associated protein